MKLKGQVALVTGSSRGMGRQMAKQLAMEGADIILTARTVEPGKGDYPGSLQEAEAEVRALGVEVLALPCDLSVAEQVLEMCRIAQQRMGHVDILVNNAFYSNDQQFQPFLKHRLETWQKYINANLLAPILTCQTFLPGMIERQRGIMVTIDSSISIRNPVGLPGSQGVSLAYNASKSGLHRFSEGLAQETEAYKIPVILIDPGTTLTERAQTHSATRGGYNLSLYHSMDVPAKVVRYVCTHPDPMLFSGKTIVAKDFYLAHQL